MLSGGEKKVLAAGIERCGKKNSCLAAPVDIIGKLPPRLKINEERLSEMLSCLEYDGYIEVILSDRHGEIVYCISLLARGRGFGRERSQEKRYVVYRIIIAVASAAVTFVFGRLLYFLIN